MQVRCKLCTFFYSFSVKKSYWIQSSVWSVIANAFQLKCKSFWRQTIEYKHAHNGIHSINLNVDCMLILMRFSFFSGKIKMLLEYRVHKNTLAALLNYLITAETHQKKREKTLYRGCTFQFYEQDKVSRRIRRPYHTSFFFR